MGETQFMKAARDKIEVELGRHTEPVALWQVQVWANDAARALGEKGVLFTSLRAYATLLPNGWQVDWVTTADENGDRVLSAVPDPLLATPIPVFDWSSLLGERRAMVMAPA